MSRRADPVGIEIVLGRVSPKPSHGRLTVFDLRGERCLARKTQFDARHRVTVIHETDKRNVLLFSSMAPAWSINPKDNGRWAGGVLRTIEVKPKVSTVDAFINQVPLDYGIGAVSRHGRLHRRSTQRRDGECGD